MRTLPHLHLDNLDDLAVLAGLYDVQPRGPEYDVAFATFTALLDAHARFALLRAGRKIHPIRRVGRAA